MMDPLLEEARFAMKVLEYGKSDEKLRLAKAQVPYFAKSKGRNIFFFPCEFFLRLTFFRCWSLSCLSSIDFFFNVLLACDVETR